MKILISTTAEGLDAELDPRYGRAACFLIVDPETLDWQTHPNPAVTARGGAGIAAAQFAADQKIEAVVSGEFGPNAFDALQAAGIRMYRFGSSRTVQEVLERFRLGQLESLGSPSSPGHHGH